MGTCTRSDLELSSALDHVDLARTLISPPVPYDLPRSSFSAFISIVLDGSHSPFTFLISQVKVFSQLFYLHFTFSLFHILP